MNNATASQSLGKHVADTLAAKERSKLWLANKTGIPYTTLGRKLLGRTTEFTFSDLLAIADALDVTPAALIPSDLQATFVGNAA